MGDKSSHIEGIRLQTWQSLYRDYQLLHYTYTKNKLSFPEPHTFGLRGKKNSVIYNTSWASYGSCTCCLFFHQLSFRYDGLVLCWLCLSSCESFSLRYIGFVRVGSIHLSTQHSSNNDQTLNFAIFCIYIIYILRKMCNIINQMLAMKSLQS